MEIQIQTTPPKKHRQQQKRVLFVTPEKQSPGEFQTPKKSNHKQQMFDSTPPKKQNPESKNLARSSKKSYQSSSKKSINITPFEINRLDSDYSFVKVLGHGNFSNVGLYESRSTRQLFAIKTTKANSISINQVQALGSLSILTQKSQNVVKYYHSWIEDNMIYLVMEYCERSLKGLFSNRQEQQKKFKEHQIKDILKQALLGLQCFHSHEIVHLDIKPENMLFVGKTLKISDLGLCRKNKIKKSGDLEQGDSRYLAKQVLNYHEGIDLRKSDIFSLGMTIYEGLIQQQLPNNGDMWISMRQKGLNLNDRMDLTDYSIELLNIVGKMTQEDWNLRPTATEILENSYFKGESKKKWKNLMNYKVPKLLKEASCGL